MAAPRAYLDCNASVPLLPAARDAMFAALELAANASSVHAEGRAARRLIDEARRAVAALVHGKSDNVVFTSGATEAASTLLTPSWRMGRGQLRMGALYVCATDHPCTLNGGHFAADQVKRYGVDTNGVVRLDELQRLLAGHDKALGLPLVAIHLANNETGVIQPVGDVARLVKDHGGVLVVDAVQAAGRIPVDIGDGCGDYLILSSHKIGGPQGAGAIVAASDLMMPGPLIVGGGQEKGHRAGTSNTAAIAGFGAAARVVAAGSQKSLEAMRDRIEAAILRVAPRAQIFGRGAERLPNTTFFSLPETKAETAQIAFDLAGVAVSAGSACSSGRIGPSHVLQAMGFGDGAGALRVSIGHSTSDSDVKRFLEALENLVYRQSGGGSSRESGKAA